MKAKSDLSAESKRKRVFLVDHFPISRLAVTEWFKETADLTLCGEADDTARALTSINHLKPDVVVTEIINQQDLGFIHSLHQRHPLLPILVFSFRDEDWYAPRVLEAGAGGYLMKGVNREGLIGGIRAVLEGWVVLSPQMRSRLLRKRHPPRRVRATLGRRRRTLVHLKPTERLRTARRSD